MAFHLTDEVPRERRMLVVIGCLSMIAGLVGYERYVGQTVPLGGFYLVPLLLAAAFMPRWGIFVMAVAAAVGREFILGLQESTPQRLALSLVAFTGGSLFAGELVRNHRIAAELKRKVEEEGRLQADAALEARALVESSPAAVLTVNAAGQIAIANESARRMLGFTSDSPEGEMVKDYLPVLATLLRSTRVVRLTRTMVEGRGYRRGGEAFYFQAWVSSYESAGNVRLASIILDVTEQIRDREESGLQQLLRNSRIIAGAVSHELRNLASAASLLHLNLGNTGGVRESKDYMALGTVIESVLKLSTEDLAETAEENLEGIDVGSVLQELRTIISPTFAEAAVDLLWEVGEPLPQVRANHSGLLQVFLNLARNSCNVLQQSSGGKLCITAYALPKSVLVRFADNGPGVAPAEFLFQPFQPGASSTGLGLFVSRAIVRTFGGELHHSQRPGECCFIVELPAVAAHSNGSST